MFDEFYLDIYRELYIKWILANKDNYLNNSFICDIDKIAKYSTSIIFKGKQVYGKIIVWKDEQEIIEQEIFDYDNNLLFYLHYRIQSILQFRTLFYEFYNALIKNNTINNKKIAFCDNNGISTSIFVEELLEVCKLVKLDYKIIACSLDNLLLNYKNYDAIYLAPQIAHLETKIILKTNNSIPIYKLNPTAYACKDYQTIIKTIQKNIKEE